MTLEESLRPESRVASSYRSKSTNNVIACISGKLDQRLSNSKHGLFNYIYSLSHSRLRIAMALQESPRMGQMICFPRETGFRKSGYNLQIGMYVTRVLRLEQYMLYSGFGNTVYTKNLDQ